MSAENILLLFIVYMVFALAYSYYRSYKMSKWPFVVGTLLRAEAFRSDHFATAKVSYEYRVNGKKFLGNRLSSLQVRTTGNTIIEWQLAKIEYVSKGAVKVYYNPKKPKKSYLVNETWLDIPRHLFKRK